MDTGTELSKGVDMAVRLVLKEFDLELRKEVENG
jgi:hypothetical protein